jgi:hypothetical protein
MSEERLVAFALDALEEAVASAHLAPVRRTWALRLALAYLASRERHGAPAVRWPFDNFWRSLAHQRPQDRWANLNASLNAIYLTVGRRRDPQRVSLFEHKASEARSAHENH